MKIGKIIIGGGVFKVKYSKNPSVSLGETINEDGTKTLNGEISYDHLVLEFIDNHEYGDKIWYFEKVFIIPDGYNDIFVLKNCAINFITNSISFDGFIVK